MPQALSNEVPFPVVDASEVDRDLFVGSKPDKTDAVERAGFKVLVLCAREYQPRSVEFGFHGSCRVLHAPIDDARLSPLEVMTVRSAANDVARAVADKRKTLVTCQMGLNRSALVAALAMLRLRPNLSASACIRVIRARRNKEALFNAYFVNLIEETARARK